MLTAREALIDQTYATSVCIVVFPTREKAFGYRRFANLI